MQQIDPVKLEFAYKYPFSNEAKEVIKSLNEKTVEDRFLTAGLLRLNEALEHNRIEFVNTNYRELRYTYLVSYVYARMLASVPQDRLVIAKYALAEAKRAAKALFEDRSENLLRISNQLGLEVSEKDGLLEVRLEQFLAGARGIDGRALWTCGCVAGTCTWRRRSC